MQTTYIMIVATLTVLSGFHMAHASHLSPTSSERLQQFVEAATNGDEATTARAIEAGIDVDGVSREGKTALLSAIIYFHQSITQILIDSGANIHHQANPFGLTPLVAAAARGNAEATALLLSHGANVGPHITSGSSPLIEAVRSNGLHPTANPTAVVQLLLQAGANPNHTSSDGRTALNIATQKQDRAITTLLLQYGATPAANVQSIQSRQELTLQLLSAIAAGNKQAAAATLEAGALINAEYAYGTTALHRAIMNFKQPIIELLIDSGANIHHINTYTTTPLMAAAMWGNAKAICLFLELGANIDHQNTDQSTILIAAIVCAQDAVTNNQMADPLKVIRLLLEAGIDPNIANNHSITALTEAACHNDPAIIKLLLRYGATVLTDEQLVELGLSEQARTLITQQARLAGQRSTCIEQQLLQNYPESSADITQLIRSFETAVKPVPAEKPTRQLPHS